MQLLSSFFDRIPYEDGNKYYLYEEIWTEYATDLLTKVFMYTAIALAAVLIAAGILVRFKKPDFLKQFIRTAAALACGFVIVVIVTMLSLGYAKIAEKGYAEYPQILGLVMIPVTILCGIAVAGIAAGYISSLFSKKTFKITLLTVASLFGAAFIALFVCLTVYYTGGSAEENNGAVITVTENAVLCVTTAVIIAALALTAVFGGKGEKKEFDSKSISYAAVCIAMSFALSYLKLWKMPQGGSVTFASLLPLMIYAYMFGAKKGVFAGLIYGTLQAIQEPFLIHPAQFLLDYPVAFSAIGLAGLFGNFKKLEKLPQIQFALGAVVASVLRFASHVLSGVFAFSEYSTLDNVWIYSMGYNAFVFADIVIVIAVGALAFSSPTLVKQARRFQPKTKADQERKPDEESV